MKDKVCITIDFFPVPGGAEAIVQQLYKALEPRYDVHFLTILPQAYAGEYRIHRIGKSRRHYFPFNPCLFPFNFVYVMLGVLKLLNLQKRYRFRYFLAQDGVFTGLYSTIVGKLTNTKVIIMDYGATTNYYSSEYWNLSIVGAYGERQHILALHNLLLRMTSFVAIKITAFLADILVITGYELKDIYLNKLKVSSSKLRSYQYCVDTSLFVPLEVDEVRERRSELGISSDAIVINVTCRLAPEKGIEYLMPALNRLVKERRDVMVLIVGGGMLDRYVSSYIEKNGLGDRVRQLGMLDRNHVLKLMQISDIFVYSGVSGSNVSLAVLEAMSCGCAVIATNSPRYHEELLNGNNGIVVPVKNTEAIYKSLKFLVGNPEKMRKIKIEARKTVLEKHSFLSFCNSLSFIDSVNPQRDKSMKLCSKGTIRK